MLNKLTNNKLIRSGDFFKENYFEKSTKYLYLLLNIGNFASKYENI